MNIHLMKLKDLKKSKSASWREYIIEQNAEDYPKSVVVLFAKAMLVDIKSSSVQENSKMVRSVRFSSTCIKKVHHSKDFSTALLYWPPKHCNMAFHSKNWLIPSPSHALSRQVPYKVMMQLRMQHPYSTISSAHSGMII